MSPRTAHAHTEGGARMRTDLWTYSDQTMAKPLDVEGFKVAATDGDIGKIDEATYDVGSSYIVVDTGPWILGRKVLLPARRDRADRPGQPQGRGAAHEGSDQEL